MVKIVKSTMAMAMVAANDLVSLLQLSASARQSQGQPIAAVAKEGEDTICVQAAAGEVAPVTGSFTARGQQAMVVAAGSVAGEAGTFCYAKQDVLLIQRTFGANTRDLEEALGRKHREETTTTTTTTWVADAPPNADNFGTFDFAGDTTKIPFRLWYKCPYKSSTLTQTMEATVSNKGSNRGLGCALVGGAGCQSAYAPTRKEVAEGAQVCACRNFFKDGFQPIHGILNESSKAAKAEDWGMVCNQAQELNDWTLIAKMINHPTEAVPTFKAANIEGWENCAKSWVIESACREDSKTVYGEACRNRERRGQSCKEVRTYRGRVPVCEAPPCE